MTLSQFHVRCLYNLIFSSKCSKKYCMSFDKRKKYNTKLIFFIIVTLMLTSVQSCGPGRGFGGPRRSRKLTPLVFKQHVPNVSENTLGASGLQEGKITKDSPKFNKLVPNYNKDIIFKDEEGTGADRLMTERCKEKLNTLAVSVMNHWPGVRLRVTEGWDDDDYHSPDSLHYEGRAVDITTSDRDRSKYGMLARLAVEAGFDWVYYESRSHIHCSVKSDSSHTSHLMGCFTAESTVTMKDGTKQRLADLQVGEKVQSIDSKGNVILSEVLTFLDRDTDQTREFVRLEVSNSKSITVTPSHLLMVWQPNTHQINYMFADKIEEGDYLLVNVDRNLEPQKVRKVSAVMSKGVYAPLTSQGTLLVDSIAASCYAVIESQTIAHWSFAPYRLFNNVWKLFKPISNQKDKISRLTNKLHQNGINWYAKALYSIKDIFLPTDWIYK
ncbi:protein hedgehog [Culicoides brevitarsis]|uniref:protein hedgehog n=1 Tax=Culicoides brevitarsis TaxID=469753 RepID=UPI00307C0AF7